MTSDPASTDAFFIPRNGEIGLGHEWLVEGTAETGRRGDAQRLFSKILVSGVSSHPLSSTPTGYDLYRCLTVPERQRIIL